MPRLFRYALCAFIIIAGLPALAVSNKGKQYPCEWTEFKSAESGCRILQLTTSPADDSGLYFTNDGFVPQENSLVFASKRTGKWNLYYMNLTDGSFVQLTDGSVGATGAAVSPATMEAYYLANRQIKAVNLHTYAERTLYTLPAGYFASTLSVTNDGRTVAFSVSEDIPIASKTDKIYSDMAERFAKKPWSAVIAVKTDGGGSGWEVHREKRWFSHTLINPRDPDLILYCQEGEWNKVPQRMWLVNSDGGANRPLRPEEDPVVAIGHEFWLKDGLRIGYQCTTKTKGKCLGIANAQTGAYQEYPGMNDNHMQSNSAGTLFVGDGQPKEPNLNLYRINNGRLDRTVLFRHGGSYEQQYYHPHPIFTPDDQGVFFTNNRDGNGNIYIAYLNQRN